MSETDKKGTIAKSKFTRFSKSLKQSVDEGLSEKTIRSRYEKFQIAWNEVQERHEEHVEHLASDTDFEKQESWIETISTEFFELKGRVAGLQLILRWVGETLLGSGEFLMGKFWLCRIYKN